MPVHPDPDHPDQATIAHNDPWTWWDPDHGWIEIDPYTWDDNAHTYIGAGASHQHQPTG